MHIEPGVELDWSRTGLSDISRVFSDQTFEQRLKATLWCSAEARRTRQFAVHGLAATGACGPVMTVLHPETGSPQEVVNLASNDYLALASAPAVVEAAAEAARTFGAGAGGVPLLAGTRTLHHELAEALAGHVGAEACLLYSSGYVANLAALQTLVREGDLAVVDMFAHASIRAGLQGRTSVSFRHNDVGDLKRRLDGAAGRYRNIVVVVDGLYSMDGDVAPLADITEIAHARGAWVYVDEAHSVGSMGRAGAGVTEAAGLLGRVDVYMGSLSKTLGAVGGFIAGSRGLIEHLRWFSAPNIFSSALPPPACAAALAALRLAAAEPARRLRLRENVRFLRAAAQEAGLPVAGTEESPIVPVILGDRLRARRTALGALERGAWVNEVEAPSVPLNSSRLRLGVRCDHTPEQLGRAVAAIAAAAAEAGD